jgi:hypothetical protein
LYCYGGGSKYYSSCDEHNRYKRLSKLTFRHETSLLLFL